MPNPKPEWMADAIITAEQLDGLLADPSLFILHRTATGEVALKSQSDRLVQYDLSNQWWEIIVTYAQAQQALADAEGDSEVAAENLTAALDLY